MLVQHRLTCFLIALALSTVQANGQAIDSERYEAALRASELAQHLDQENKLEEALAEYNRAEALNPRRFSLYENRGFVNGRLGHWSSAIADFDRFFKSSREYQQTEKVLTFLLEHTKADVALRLSKSLDDDEPTAQSLILKSKIWQANHNLTRAREVAFKAKYLTDIYDDKENKQQVESWMHKLGLETKGSATPNQSKEDEFWHLVKSLSERDAPLEPSELPQLISPPGQTVGYNTIGNRKIPLTLQSTSADAPIRSIGIGGAQEKFATMADIQPNIFTCCLTPEDVKQHFKGATKSEDLNGLGGAADQLPDTFLTLSGDKCTVVFQFRGPGIYPLKFVQFYWKKNGKTQLSPTIPPPHVFSAAEIDQLIKKGRFTLARQALTNELTSLITQNKYETGARAEYERIKRSFENLYSGAGEIALSAPEPADDKTERARASQ